MIAWGFVGAIVTIAASGVPGLFTDRQSPRGERVATKLMIAGSALGLVTTVLAVIANSPVILRIPWGVPGGEVALYADGVADLFLFPVFLVPVLGSVFGLAYWPQARNAENGRKLRLFYGLTSAALAVVVLARNSIFFLGGYEVMTLAGFAVVTTDDTNEDVRASGFIYLASTRIGTLCLFAAFATLHVATGSFEIAVPAGIVVPVATRNAIFILALAGFGFKAGLMPLHIWLPGAHANAPSHVSALMSGVLLKMGIYGIVRIPSLFVAPPLWWGIVVVTMGAISGVLGVAFALGQHDLKRLLAYHSVENIGIIAIGLGLAMVGRAVGRPEIVALGLAGALFHVWNHALFKSLLFLSAGAVIHATGTREMDRLGGVAKAMPKTALAFLVGAVAICGLPPLNGFASELLIYLGLFHATMMRTGGLLWLVGAFATSALALIGALALACFAKAFGIVFLGEGRTGDASHAHEGEWPLLVPMGVLAGCCGLLGFAPLIAGVVLDRAARSWAPELVAPSVSTLAPLGALTMTGGVLLLSLLAAVYAWRTATRHAVPAATWGCGYDAPRPSMQYTSSSFAETLVGLFAWALAPEVHAPAITAAFPRPASFSSHVRDAPLDLVVLPATKAVARAAHWLRWVQQGSIQMYVLYVLAVFLVTLVWARAATP